MEQATELEFLKYFYRNVDLGPADGDVRQYIEDNFVEETGKALPWGYGNEE